MNRYITAIFFLFVSLAAFAHCPHMISVGPEFYHLKRVRDGGTEQDGWISGVRISLERMKRYGWYLGVDYLYAQGDLSGHTGRGDPLDSDLADQIFEIRFGYTLQKNGRRRPFFTPFGGWGYFEEINHFHHPSPIPVKFTDTFRYIAAGFLSGVNFTPLLSMGVNFKVKFMQNGKSEVSEDPFMDDVTLLMQDEIQIRLDVPLTYALGNPCRGINCQFAPFYEFRHFGGREGFPFNFRDTKFYIYGAKIALTYRF